MIAVHGHDLYVRGQARLAQVSAVRVAQAATPATTSASGVEDARHADAALNRVWKTIEARYADEANVMARLRDAEREWIRFRDAMVAAHSALMLLHDGAQGHGSDHAASVDRYRAQLTRERTRQLQRWLPDASVSASYPVWMASGFTLGVHEKPFPPSDKAAWRRYFAQLFRDPDGRPIVFTPVKGLTNPSRRKVGNCQAAFNAAREGYELGYPDRPIYRAWLNRCYAGWIVRKMTAARRSYVAAFTLSPRAVAALPVLLRPYLSRSRQANLQAKQRHGGTLQDALGRAKVKKTRHAGEVEIDYADGFSQTLKILAKGDYDHDGTQDVLVRSSSSIEGGTHVLYNQALYVLTRDAQGGAFRILLAGNSDSGRQALQKRTARVGAKPATSADAHAQPSR